MLDTAPPGQPGLPHDPCSDGGERVVHRVGRKTVLCGSHRLGYATELKGRQGQPGPAFANVEPRHPLEQTGGTIRVAGIQAQTGEAEAEVLVCRRNAIGPAEPSQAAREVARCRKGLASAPRTRSLGANRCKILLGSLSRPRPRNVVGTVTRQTRSRGKPSIGRCSTWRRWSAQGPNMPARTPCRHGKRRQWTAGRAIAGSNCARSEPASCSPAVLARSSQIRASRTS